MNLLALKALIMPLDFFIPSKQGSESLYRDAQTLL